MLNYICVFVKMPRYKISWLFFRENYKKHLQSEQKMCIIIYMGGELHKDTVASDKLIIHFFTMKSKSGLK